MKQKKPNHNQDMTKAIHIASRNAQFERNGGGQFVSMNKIHKNKKKYNRKKNKKVVLDDTTFFMFM